LDAILTSYQLRKATLEDVPELHGLIARSARGLSTKDYSSAQIEGALRGAFGVDTQLIQDGTYFVIEAGSELVCCGGWSYRRTLFGGDARPSRDATELDPRVDPAKIRAFFVDPSHARQGLGSQLLEHCESQARERGFRRVELMSTLPGQRLYAARGYEPGQMVRHPVGSGVAIEFVPMSKAI
jgi:GNAT superfamily N-acetyltransferase